MVTISDVKYIITASTSGAVKEIQKVDTSIDGMKRQAQKSISPLKGMFGQLVAGFAGTVAIGTAIHKLAGFLKDATEKAKAQETAEKGLMDALQSTGREIPINAGHFKDYAKELQDATKYGDEQILSAQALLIQLTNLDRDGLDAATKGSLGLATVFKTDLKSATNLVAKALAGNYGALSRYGISVTDLNTDEEKRASLLEQLGVLYERSKGEVDTYEGAVTQLKNTYGDFQEKIGDVIVKSDELRGAIQSIQDLMNNFVESGTMDNWAAKLDLLIKHVPILQSWKQGLFLMNAEMEIMIAKQKKAKETGEAWIKFLEESDAELKIFGVDVYEAMRSLISFGDSAKGAETEITLLETSLHPLLATMDDVKRVAKEAQPELKAMFEEAVPAARNLLDVVDQAPSEFKEAEDAGVQAAQYVKDEWTIASERLQDAWAREIGEMIAEFKSFKDFFNDILGEMWRIFADFIGKMIVKWATDFLQNTLISKTKSAASTATGALTGGGTGGGGGLGGLLSGGGGGLGGLWTGLGAAAGTLIAGLITGGGVSKRTGQDQLHEARLTNILLYQTQQHELHWINDNLNLMYTQFTELLLKSDAMIRIQRDIRKNLGGIPKGQHGLDFYSGSRGGYVQYDPYEHILIQPKTDVNITPSATQINVYLDGKKIKEQLTWDSKWRGWKLHPRVTNKRF